MVQLIGFVFAGGVATILNFLVFLGLLELGAPATPAAAIGYLSGIAISFTINKLWIFKDSKGASPIRYLIAYGVALVAQLALLNALMAIGMAPELANACSIAVIVVLNYFFVRKFVFKSTGP
jgi:putative flippase GtrA